MRLLAIERATRSPKYSEYPTIAETLPGYENGGRFGFIAPAKMSKEQIALLKTEMNRAMKLPDVAEKLDTLELEVHTEPPEYFTTVIRRDMEKWGKVTRDIGFKPR